MSEARSLSVDDNLVKAAFCAICSNLFRAIAAFSEGMIMPSSLKEAIIEATIFSLNDLSF